MKVLADIVRTHGRERPHAPALQFEGASVTYGQLDVRSSRAAQALRAAGVGAHDRFAYFDKNRPEFFELLFAGAKLNAVPVAVNWRLAPIEVAGILNDAQAKVLVVGAEFAEVAEKIRAELETVSTVVVLGDEYEAWIGDQPDRDPGAVSEAEDVAVQLYTSGTTGLPKGVMLTNANIFTNLSNAVQQWRFTPESVNIIVMPLFHIAGSAWALVSMFAGSDAVLLREVDASKILDAIPRYGVTNVLLVPAVLQFVLDEPGVDEADFSSVHTFVYGASPISDRVLVRGMEVFGCDFVQVYGLTETTGAITQLDAADHDPDGRPGLLRSCGKPFPWVELRIVDPASGDDAGVGEVGELWTRSAQNMKGYWNKPEETARALDADRWFRTGDAGYYDAEGFVFLHDRVKDMIVSGAENIYPAEVENAVMQHPDVADVAVIGVPDDRWGETVKAVVVLRAGGVVTASDIIAFTRDRLAHFKCPTSVDFTDELPRNPSGKLLKRELREPYWIGRERRIS